MGRTNESGGVRPHRDGIQIDIYYRGKRLRPTLGLKATPPNLKYARRLREEIRQKIQQGTFSYEAYFPDARNAIDYAPAPQSFSVFADKWLATLKVEDSTYRSYVSSLDFHWRPAIGNKDLKAIKPSELMEVVAPLSAKTRNNTMIPVRSVFALAMDDGLIEKDPSAKVKSAKVQKDDPDPLTLEEIELVLADMGRRDAELRDYFEVAFFTGMRPSEQIFVHWRDLDRNSDLLRVHRARVWGVDKETTKTHQSRDIELLQRARDAIQRQRARTELAGGLIFRNPNTGRAWHDEKAARLQWNASLKRCGLRHRVAYQTRHTFATLALMSGANPAWVARQMGHKSLKMFFEVYARWIDRADKGMEKAKLDAATVTSTVTSMNRSTKSS